MDLSFWNSGTLSSTILPRLSLNANNSGSIPDYECAGILMEFREDGYMVYVNRKDNFNYPAMQKLQIDHKMEN